MKPIRFLLPVIALVVAAAPVATSAGAPPWHVYNLAASGRTLTSPQAAGVNDDEATFDFLATPTTSYLLNHQIGGDISTKTITATFSITGDGTLFFDENPPNTTGTPYVRIFFETSSEGGFSPTNFWWSHAGAAYIHVDGNVVQITADVSNAADWTDFYGEPGNVQPFAAGFDAAAASATYVGLSFGGGFFFANGVGVENGTATFHLDSFVIG